MSLTGERPHWPSDRQSPTMRTRVRDRTQLWRAVGWYGSSGALYAWDDKPSHQEGSDFKPVWVLVADEPLAESGSPTE